MESEWIDGMKVFLHVHGINLYRIYTLSPKQLVAEILHQAESRKPYKLWDKLHINWFAAFVFRWKSPMSASGCISNIHPALEGLGLKGRPKIWPMNSGVFLIDSHEVVNNQQISGPTWLRDYLIIPNSSYCKLQDVFFNHFLNSQASEGTFDPLDTVSSLFCHIYTVQVETEQTESGWKDAFHLVDMTMPGLLRTSPKWIKTQMVRFKIIDLSPHLQLESRWCCFPFVGL